MCGITAAIGSKTVLDQVLDGLENLEYRGYDSAGVAVDTGTQIARCRRSGEIAELVDVAAETVDDGYRAIGHTRWSTHGAPTDANAHPHTSCRGRVAVVHNGIIENHETLRRSLRRQGHEFTSDTDTEVVPHLIERELGRGASPATAVRRALDELEGSYALAVIVEGDDTVFAARDGSPLAIGLGDERRYLASDAPAFLEYTDEVVYLEDGDVARLGRDGYAVRDDTGAPVDREVTTVDWEPEDAEKGAYDHFMLKEIYEQPSSLKQTIRSRVADGEVALDDIDAASLAACSRVHLVACGTSFHAALYGERLLRKCGIDAATFRATEYATAPPPIDEDVLVVAVTQSGETADTLEAVERASEQSAQTLAVTNVVGSTITRTCDQRLLIRAGPEIGVAATKTFTSQVAMLLLLADRLVAYDESVAADGVDVPLDAVASLPAQAEDILATSAAETVARQYYDADSFFFIGRGICHPVALEGALKLKEISYEHAEGYPAGELKHGPLALVTEDTPVIALLTGEDDEKTVGNVREVQARGAPVIVVAPADSDVAHSLADHVLTVPPTVPELAGVLVNLQLQLFSYHVADTLDRAIDKPRNLAKSVTVE